VLTGPDLGRAGEQARKANGVGLRLGGLGLGGLERLGWVGLSLLEVLAFGINLNGHIQIYSHPISIKNQINRI